MNLSKSKYVRGLQCPKMLWMDKYKNNILKAAERYKEMVS